MKTVKLGPPEYPYPIQKCVSPKKVRWWHRMACAIWGHEQCGFHWEQHEDFCCRCLLKEE
jgi:hypothetical protein